MGKPKSPEHRAKIAEALRGKPKSADHRSNLSATRKSMSLHPAFVEAAKAAAVGREWSEESRQKLSSAKTKPIEERFWSKVATGGPDDCWEWNGARQKLGYGTFSVGSKLDGTKRTELAHRVAWELTNGPIPEGVKIRHFTCDNPPCCNPAHLREGTQADNMQDMIGKGRKHIIRGADHPEFKLTDEVKLAIRAKYAAGGVTQWDLAREFDLHQSTISRVILDKTYH